MDVPIGCVSFPDATPLPCLATSQDPLPGRFRLHRPAPGPCWRIKKWWTILIIPIGSMVLEYLPTFGSYMGQMLSSSKTWRMFNILLPNNRGIAVPQTQKTATFHPILHPILVSALALNSPRLSVHILRAHSAFTQHPGAVGAPQISPRCRCWKGKGYLVPLFLFPEHGWILLVSFVSLDYKS